MEEYLKKLQSYAEALDKYAIALRKKAIESLPKVKRKAPKKVIDYTSPQVIVEPAPVATFAKTDFHNAVMATVKAIYTEVTPSTVFFRARDMGMVTPAGNIDQVVGYWEYLLELANEAFSYHWGYSYEKALADVKSPGCPNCTVRGTCPSYSNLKLKAMALGPEFYGSYLDLERTKTKLENVRSLKSRGIDFKAKLYPQHRTLYYVGELAEYIGKTT